MRKKERSKERLINDDECYTWKLKGRTIKKLYRIMGFLMMQENRSLTQDELIARMIELMPEAKGVIWVKGEGEETDRGDRRRENLRADT